MGLESKLGLKVQNEFKVQVGSESPNLESKLDLKVQDLDSKLGLKVPHSSEVQIASENPRCVWSPNWTWSGA